ncbi:MAG: 2-hydroxychromene-2-carboxylate isomerase [Myxococcales bacterium]|nr:2-hydroxychromene-2-carboxylate isomerase [Myxococcales bacterium]
MSDARRVECFFDYSSPFAYLGTTQIERVATEEGATLNWRPFLLGALFRAIGTPDVPIATFSEAKRQAILLDLRRWAAVHGVGFRFPSSFPLRTVEALRLTYAAPADARSALIGRIMRAAWVDDEGVSRDVLRRCCADVGLDAALVDAVDAPAPKLALREATREAEARGVPGAPTFITHVAGQTRLVWGQDRLLFVRLALRGELEE